MHFTLAKYKNICYLIRRLELGLIIVSLERNNDQVEIKIPPSSFDRKKSMERSRNKRSQLLKELKGRHGDRKSTRLNSSHVANSYAVFCLKKKLKINIYE